MIATFERYTKFEKACMEAIREFGINKIVYTTDSGYAIEFIRDDD